MQVEKRLKALPDFGNAGVWVDDDTMEVTEALGPIKEVNGSEAKFLLRFLFKRAAMFRESDVKAATQVRLAACAHHLLASRTLLKTQANEMQPHTISILSN